MPSETGTIDVDPDPGELNQSDTVGDLYDDELKLTASYRKGDNYPVHLLLDNSGSDLDQLFNDRDVRPGRVRAFINHPEAEGVQHTDYCYDKFKHARLYFGLITEVGGWDKTTIAEGGVPVSVATAGQDAIAAYLRTRNGRVTPRATIAYKMDLSKATISNYWNRVRFEIDD